MTQVNVILVAFINLFGISTTYFLERYMNISVGGIGHKKIKLSEDK